MGHSFSAKLSPEGEHHVERLLKMLATKQAVYRHLHFKHHELKALTRVFVSNILPDTDTMLARDFEHMLMAGQEDIHFIDHVFELFDDHGSGKLDIHHWVKGCFCYCTTQRSSLARLTMDIYDAEGLGEFSVNCMVKLLIDVFGDNWEENKNAMNVMQKAEAHFPFQLTALDSFLGMFPNLLHIVFLVQHRLQDITLGHAGWEKLAKRSRQHQTKKAQDFHLKHNKALAMKDADLAKTLRATQKHAHDAMAKLVGSKAQRRQDHVSGAAVRAAKMGAKKSKTTKKEGDEEAKGEKSIKAAAEAGDESSPEKIAPKAAKRAAAKRKDSVSQVDTLLSQQVAKELVEGAKPMLALTVQQAPAYRRSIVATASRDQGLAKQGGALGGSNRSSRSPITVVGGSGNDDGVKVATRRSMVVVNGSRGSINMRQGANISNRKSLAARTGGTAPNGALARNSFATTAGSIRKSVVVP